MRWINWLLFWALLAAIGVGVHREQVHRHELAFYEAELARRKEEIEGMLFFSISERWAGVTELILDYLDTDLQTLRRRGR